jgi:hypothetical protein
MLMVPSSKHIVVEHDSRLGQTVSDLKTHLRISLDRGRAGFEDIAGVET